MRLFLGLATLLLGPTWVGAQVTINSVAGGTIRSGVPAEQVVLGTINSMAFDPQGNLVFAEQSRDVIRRIRPDGIIETIAGTGVSGFAGDGGPAMTALLHYPTFLQFDPAGNLYFVDAGNNRIRRIDPTGTITTAAGTGVLLAADDPPDSPRIGPVAGLAIDQAGSVYFSETSGPSNGPRSWVRRLRPSGGIEAFAGTGTTLINDIPDDGVAALSADLDFASSLAFDSTGNLYIVESGFDLDIVQVSPDGVLKKFAGFYGPTASGDGGPALTFRFTGIGSLAGGPSDSLYVGDGTFLRVIGPDGNISTLAGDTNLAEADAPDGLAAKAHLISTKALAADSKGNVRFVDSDKIREVTSSSTLTTIAGGSVMPAQDGTPARDAWFANSGVYYFGGGHPAIAVGPNGDLFITELKGCQVRKIGADGLLATVAGTGKCATTASTGPALSTDLSLPLGLAVDSKGTVYISDNAGKILVVSAGQISILSAVTGNILALDSKDRLYLGNGLVRYTPGGAAENLLSWLTNTGIHFVDAVGVDAAGNVYVAGGPSGPASLGRPLYKFTPDGAGTPLQSTFYQVNSIAITGVGDLWLAAGFLMNGQGYFLGQYNGFSGDGGPLQSAFLGAVSSVAATPTGDVYLYDEADGRVRKLTGAPPAQKPVIAPGGIVNAASLLGGAVAPGELISIFGSNLGPATLQMAVANNNNSIPLVLGNVRVYFENAGYGAIAGAVAGQINVFVPYEVAGRGPVAVRVLVDGVASDPVTVPLAYSAFGIVSADSSGSGQGAILNQDGSFNNATSPAPRGSVITMFGTGEGLVTPLLPDGGLSVSMPFSKAIAPITVTIGGQPAEVLYAGSAPFEPIGVFQINARIPAAIPSGFAPIGVSIGNTMGASSVTVAVN